MASKENAIAVVDPHQLASVIRSNRLDKVLIVDSRSFLEYNDLHVIGAVNVCCSKLVKRRLQQDKVCVRDFLLHSCHLERGLVDESGDVIVYDQSSVSLASVSPDSFLHVLLHKLVTVFRRVFLLSGGFLEFQACYGDLCEDKSRLLGGMGLSMMGMGRAAAAVHGSLMSSLTSISQPCLPITNVGPTRILPFLYLGSQQDAHNQELLSDYNITYEVNVSTNCPKPDFILDSHFLRLPVNDSYGEKLLPYFVRAIQFIDKVRDTNGAVLVHCLAGISRSPTVAIAYVMRHLRLTFDDAFRYVKSKRVTISPNFNFLGQLLEYERQLRAEEVLDDSSLGVPDASSSSSSSSCASQPATQSSTTAAATASSNAPSPSIGSFRCPLVGNNSSASTPGVGGRERLSRSISLSLSLKSPGGVLLETVPHSCSPSPISASATTLLDQHLHSPFGFTSSAVDEVDHIPIPRPLTADLSPTTALARLSFDAAMDASSQSTISGSEDVKESGHSYVLVSRRKHLREESYRSLHQRLSTSTSSSTSSSSSSESHFYSQQKTETSQRSSSSSHVVLTVSQSKRVTSVPPCPSGRTGRWKSTVPSASSQSSVVVDPDFCSEISVQIEESASPSGQQAEEAESEVEIRHRRVPTNCPRPHSDGGFRNLLHQSGARSSAPVIGRRPSYAPSESSSSILSSATDEMLLPPTPSSPPPSHHCLLSPQTSWGGGLYARSDSVTTSGLGSEISDSDYTRADDALSMCSGMSGLRGSADAGAEMDSLAPDDGVFTESNQTSAPASASRQFQPPPARSTRPRPSSLLGIIPVRDLDWRPSVVNQEPDESLFPSSPFPSVLLKGRPPPSSSPGFETDHLSSTTSSTLSGEELPDSATVFRLWRQREAAMEQDRPESHHGPTLSSIRRRSKELLSTPVTSRLLTETTTTTSSSSSGSSSVSKRKSSELPEDLMSPSESSAQSSDGGSSSAVESTSNIKRRTTRGDAAVGDRSSSQCDEGCLYRVKSCPDIVDQLTTTTKAECDPSPQSSQLVAAQLKEKRVRLRARDSARDQRPLADQQRYSCGALEQAVVRLSSDDGDDEITSVQQLSSPYGSNQSLSNCNSFSVIKVS